MYNPTTSIMRNDIAAPRGGVSHRGANGWKADKTNKGGFAAIFAVVIMIAVVTIGIVKARHNEKAELAKTPSTTILAKHP